MIKNYLFLFVVAISCNGNDSEQQLMQLQQNFDLDCNKFLSGSWFNKGVRIVPFVGQGWDFVHCVTKKIKYHQIASTKLEVRTQTEWDNYINRLKQNNESINGVLKSLLKLVIADAILLLLVSATDVSLMLSLHYNDNAHHWFVYLYSGAMIVRATSLSIMASEKYRFRRVDPNKPRLMQLHEVSDIDVEADTV